jgi:transcriptional regulator with XRE-family HTH domain
VPYRLEETRLRRQLAAGLKRERARLRWTQEQAAEKAEMNIRHYQKVEAGVANVTLRTLAKLARALDVEVARLFER